MKRLFDLFFVLLLAPLILPLYLLVYLCIWISSGRPVLYWSDRVGLENKIFKMPKFRTMRHDTPQVASHLLDSKKYMLPLGALMRKFSLDEIPQLYSILIGDMTFVGPRPALFNQDDLIRLRTEAGVHKLIPGLTGWAQVNGRDELAIPLKVEFDREYLVKQNFLFDLKILLITFFKVLGKSGVSH